MGERKVLNRYIPPDFDPSIIPKYLSHRGNKMMEIRMMLPFSLRCNTCQEYMYKVGRFNYFLVNYIHVMNCVICCMYIWIILTCYIENCIIFERNMIYNHKNFKIGCLFVYVVSSGAYTWYIFMYAWFRYVYYMLLALFLQWFVIYEQGKKFNSKKEDIEGDTYMGIKKFRFYIKCSVCSAEITFKTDPKNADYECEVQQS